MNTPSNTFSEEWLGMILQNFAVCREHVGGEEYMKSGDFEAHLLLCFGKRDPSKKPIDDLFSKATAAILKRHKEELLAAYNAGKREGEAREAVYQLTWCSSNQVTKDEYAALIQHYTEIVEEIEQLQASNNTEGESL